MKISALPVLTADSFLYLTAIWIEESKRALPDTLRHKEEGEVKIDWLPLSESRKA